MLLGTGTSNFAPAPGSPVATAGATSLAAADINGDGNIDLVAVSGNLADVLLGDGAGGFTRATNAPYSTDGNTAEAVTVADVNGDGKPDILVTNFSSNNLSVLLGDGAGNFSAATLFPTGGLHPYSVAVADVNGDGNADAVIANFDSDNVSVLLGNGTGAFTPAADSPFLTGGNGAIFTTVADVNGDGRPDLIVSNYSTHNVSVLLGLPNATTGFAVTAPANVTPGTPFSITVDALHSDRLRDGLYNGTIRFTTEDGAAVIPFSLPYSIGGNAPFSLSDDGSRTFQIILNASGTHTITVSDTLSGAIFGTATVIADSTPTDLALSTDSVLEKQPSGTTVGTLSTTDADSGDTFTCTLVSGVGSIDNASFSIVGNTLKTAASFVFLTKSSYTIRVRTTDSAGMSLESTFTITVINSNRAPTDLTLSSTSVAEKQPVGATVGTLSTTDPDAGNAFTYTLVSGEGSTDNASFSIVGDTLQTAAVFNYSTKSSYSIRIRSTDQNGLFTEKSLTITITAPAVARLAFVQAPANVAAGQSRSLSVHLLNADGSVNTTDKKSKITLKILSGPKNGKLLGVKATAARNGTVTFQKVSFTVAGDYVLQATGGSYLAMASSQFTVSAAAATKILFSQVPTSAQTNQLFSARVTLYDKYGNVATNDSRSIKLTLGKHPKGSVLSGVLTGNLDAGTELFTDLSVNVAGAYSLSATGGKLKATSKGSLRVSA